MTFALKVNMVKGPNSYYEPFTLAQIWAFTICSVLITGWFFLTGTPLKSQSMENLG